MDISGSGTLDRLNLSEGLLGKFLPRIGPKSRSNVRFELPLLIRAMPIVPRGPEIDYVDQKLDDPIKLRIYHGADCGFRLYQDKGVYGRR